LLWSVIVPKNADLIWCRSLQRNERHTFVAVVIIQVLRLDYKQLFFSSSSIPTFSYRIHRQHTYSVKIACKQRTVNIQKERIRNHLNGIDNIEPGIYAEDHSCRQSTKKVDIYKGRFSHG